MLVEITEYSATKRTINVPSPVYFHQYGSYYCVNEKGNILQVGYGFLILTTQVNKNYNEELQKVLTMTPITMDAFYTQWQATIDRIEAAVTVKT